MELWGDVEMPRRGWVTVGEEEGKGKEEEGGVLGNSGDNNKDVKKG